MRRDFMADCTHDCSTCGENCGERSVPKEKQNEFSNVKKIYAVISGKGGVGKSLVTSLLAVEARRRGKTVAILDADLTGPSIPKAFGVTEKATGDERGIFPAVTTSGIKMMSINLLLENDSDPVVWRGPVIAGTVKQFYTDVLWGDADIMFVDCPPGTGDVPLTVFQSLPIDGIIIVASPQELVSMIVEKAVNMAEMMNVPIIGAVENMAYFICDKCGEKHYIYGKGNLKQVAAARGITAFAEIPFDKTIANLCDRGLIEQTDKEFLKEITDKIV